METKETKEITYYDLKMFYNISDNYLKSLDDKKTRLSWAIERVLTKAKKTIEDFQNEINLEVNTINANTAPLDEKGFLTTIGKEGTIQWKPKELIEKNKKTNALIAESDNKLLKIEIYYATEVPKDLTYEQVHYFSGLVINPKDAKEIYEYE